MWRTGSLVLAWADGLGCLPTLVGKEQGSSSLHHQGAIRIHQPGLASSAGLPQPSAWPRVRASLACSPMARSHSKSSKKIVWEVSFGLLLLLLLLSCFSCVRLCATPEMAAYQALLSLGFSRQEHWSGLPFPSPMHESKKWKWSRSVSEVAQKWSRSEESVSDSSHGTKSPAAPPWGNRGASMDLK